MNSNVSKLIRKYPFVSDILATSMEPYGTQEGADINDVIINVEQANGDLMFRYAKNIGLEDSVFAYSRDVYRKDQVMQRGEYLFAVNNKNKIVNRANWPRSSEECRLKICGCSTQWSTINDDGFGSDPVCDDDELKYLVWVTVDVWHMKSDGVSWEVFGEFRDRKIRITIYNEPNEGFETLQEESSVYSNLLLNNQLMMRGIIDKNRDIMCIQGMIYEMCITFKNYVYFNGMKDMIDSDRFCCMSGYFDSVKMLYDNSRVNNRIILEDTVSNINFQPCSESTLSLVSGQQGTLPQIRNLITTVVNLWNEKPELRSKSFR